MSLEAIAEDAAALARLDEALSNVKRRSKELQAQHEHYARVSIPDLMVEAGIDAFTLATGEKVELQQFIAAGITPANRDRVFEWLRDNDKGDLIKSKLVIWFPKEREAEARKLQQFCVKKELDAELEQSIHPSTLKAFIKNACKRGAFPLRLWDAYVGIQAKVKKP